MNSVNVKEADFSEFVNAKSLESRIGTFFESHNDNHNY